MDTYTRFILTIIAAALVVIAFRGTGATVIPEAYAADRLDCRIDGPVEIKGLRDLRVTIDDPVEIKQAFSEAGSSSGSPMYVKTVD